MKNLFLAILALSLVGCATKGQLESTRQEIGTFSLTQANNWLEVERFYSNMEKRVQQLEVNQAMISGMQDKNEKAIIDLTKMLLPVENAAETTPQPHPESEIVFNGK